MSTAQKAINAILQDRTTSYWLKDALAQVHHRDLVDYMNDLELLQEAIRMRATENGQPFSGEHSVNNPDTVTVTLSIEQAKATCLAVRNTINEMDLMVIGSLSSKAKHTSACLRNASSRLTDELKAKGWTLTT